MNSKKKWLSTVIAAGLSTGILVGTPPVALIGQAHAVPTEINGDDGSGQQSNRGDYEDDAPPAVSDDEATAAKDRQQREREIAKERARLKRLKELGVGQNKAAAPAAKPDTDDSEPKESDDDSSSSSDAAIGEPVKGAGQPVKSNIGGPGPVGEIKNVPKDAGVGAPNPVAWKAVQKGVDLLVANGGNVPYSGTRPAIDTSKNPSAGIDCSGLVLVAYGAAGIVTPGIASGQVYSVANPKSKTTEGPYPAAEPVTSKKLKKIAKIEDALPGDLAIMGSGAGAGSHVAMVISNNKGNPITQDYGGGNLMQYAKGYAGDSRGFSGIFRPSVLEGDKPVIPEAGQKIEKKDSGDDEKKGKDEETPARKDDE